MAEGERKNHLEVEGDGLLRIRQHASMKVDAMIVADHEHLARSSDDRSISQLVNIASMPGVVGEAWAMPDWHFGYGFPIGGVLATDVEWGEQGGDQTLVGFRLRRLQRNPSRDELRDYDH